MVPTLNNQDERSEKLNSAKEKALILIRNGDKKLAKISFLNDCKIYNLYPIMVQNPMFYQNIHHIKRQLHTAFMCCRWLQNLCMKLFTLVVLKWVLITV